MSYQLPLFKEHNKVYGVYFQGYYPIGAVAVVFAPNPGAAISLLEPVLKENNLEQGKELEVRELDPKHSLVHILLDGNY